MTNAALHVARTGLDAQNPKMQVIANNLANVNTTGFKKDRANFATLAYHQIVEAGSQSDAENTYAVGLSLGSGVQLPGTARSGTPKCGGHRVGEEWSSTCSLRWA